jgi:hypothetical protein
MTKPLGTYSFLPWLRQGLANQIQTADFDDSVRVRAEVNVQLTLSGEKPGGGSESLPPISRPVALFGPGDIVGIEGRAIVRIEPRNWITNFEPNYLPAIEFYDEDFPWRYTPAAPDLGKNRLRPWIMLLVLKEEVEFTEGKNIKDRPLPYIDVTDLNVFPRADELWAWAHVHVNESLAANDGEFVSTDMNAVIPKFENLLQRNPDLAYSRIVCPRKLDENAAYHAFLIPVFEAGRRAGLGLELGDIPATMSAWDSGPRPDGVSFPYYYRWFFRTGSTGDFETLVRLLVPKPVDRRVGTREMDVLDPGSNVSAVDNPDLGGILKLGGALRPPSKVPPEPPDVFETWDDPFPRPLQEDLADLINLADNFHVAGHPDPIITAPLYGTWHALTKRVLTNRDGTAITPAENWVHRLNLDPRFRVAAGFGTRVVQDNQEKYMDAAWEQIGSVLDAQRRIRCGQFGLLVSDIWFDRHLLPMLAVSQQKTLLLMAPLNKRVLTNDVTLQHALTGSFVQPPMTSAALRRIIRPRGRLIQTLPFDATHTPDQLLTRVNAGEVSAAPPKVAPPGVLTTDQAAELVVPKDAPAVVVDWLRRYPQLPLIVLVIAILLALVLLLLLPLVFAVLAIAIIALGIYVYRRLTSWARALRTSDLIRESNQTPEAIDSLPPVSDFKITEPGSGFVPRTGGSDSIEATRFKAALRDSFQLIRASATVGAIAPKVHLALDVIARETVQSINPGVTIPKRLLAGIFVPPHVFGDLFVPPAASFVEPMAYPIIDQPMYEPLANRSSELFLPNINLIEVNSITLLETNQRFIESYMVGLNHEFARELLWREYPTDQRGSTFRQFWDVRSIFKANNVTDEDLREKLRDITPLHTWAKNTTENPDLEKLLLGTHDNRLQGAPPKKRLVLVIRGELLKRYPTAVIYAHRACWQRKQVTPADKDKEPCLRSGAIDNTQERRLTPLEATEEDNPPRSKIQTPMFEAKIDPDIYFFGFDLTVEDVMGGTGEQPDDDAGWFFVIKERPGEPRFGLDSDQQPEINVWNDLSWPDLPLTAPGNFIEIAASPTDIDMPPPGTAEQEEAEQHADDLKIVWSHNMSSAELAYILWQAPVLVAVHASEMLPKKNG